MSEPTPLSAEERYPIEIIQGVEGFCIGLNNYRIAGPKPWGGGTVVKRWDVSLADLGRAIPSIDAQATEIAALRAVSSQQQQRAQLAEEKLEGYRQALDIDHIEIVISQELRRLYVGQLDALHVAEQHREAVEACFLCAVKKPPFDAAVRQAARVLAGWEARCPKCEGRGFIRDNG